MSKINYPCPKKYGSYDQRIDDCQYCKEALLHVTCSVGRNHPACAGWNRDDGCYCCTHYVEKENGRTN
jgi:hypothetical protein